MTTPTTRIATPPLDRVLPFVAKTATQLLACAFYLTAVLAVLVSGRVEFAVVNSFFAKHAAIRFISFPLAAVFALETAKVFLVFFNRQYSSTNDVKYVPVRHVFTTIRYSLVGVSFLSMLLFALYSLNNPEHDSVLARSEEQLQEEAQHRVALIDTSYAARKAEQYKLDGEQVELWRARMAFEMNNVVGRTWEGPYFASHKARWEQARQQQADHKTRLEVERLDAVNAVYDRVHRDLDSARLSVGADPASRNAMLAGALQILNGSPHYPAWQYVAAATLASLLLSFTLEGTMWAAFTVLAITYGDAFATALAGDEIADQYATVTRTKTRRDQEEWGHFESKVMREKRGIIRMLQDLLHGG
jgi:hypothetical protein